MDQNSVDEIPFEVVKDIMSDFKDLLNTADSDQRKTFLQLIVKKITVGKDNKIQTIQIHFTETLSHLVKDCLEEPSSENEGSDFVFTLSI